MYTNEELLAIFEKEMNVSLRQKEDSTIRQNMARMRRFSDAVNKPLLSVQQLDIKEYIINLVNLHTGEMMKDQSKTENLSSIRLFYNAMYASDDTEIISMRNAVNPVSNLKGSVYSGGAVNEKKKDAFTQEELELLFSAIRDEIKNTKKKTGHHLYAVRDYAFFTMLFNTGFRISELTNLKFADIDFNTNEIKVYKTKSNRSKKVRVAPSTINVLMNYLDEAKRDIVEDDYVFPGKKNRPLGTATMNVRLKKYGLSVGIDETLLHNHTFRHTCATILYNQSQDFNLVKDALGHETISTSERYVSSDDLREKAMKEQSSVFESIVQNLLA